MLKMATIPESRINLYGFDEIKFVMYKYFFAGSKEVLIHLVNAKNQKRPKKREYWTG